MTRKTRWENKKPKGPGPGYSWQIQIRLGAGGNRTKAKGGRGIEKKGKSKGRDVTKINGLGVQDKKIEQNRGRSASLEGKVTQLTGVYQNEERKSRQHRKKGKQGSVRGGVKMSFKHVGKSGSGFGGEGKSLIWSRERGERMYGVHLCREVGRKKEKELERKQRPEQGTTKVKKQFFQRKGRKRTEKQGLRGRLTGGGKWGPNKSEKNPILVAYWKKQQKNRSTKEENPRTKAQEGKTLERSGGDLGKTGLQKKIQTEGMGI